MNKAPKEFLLRLQGQGGGGREGYTRYICTYIHVYIRGEGREVFRRRPQGSGLKYLCEHREDIKFRDEPKRGKIIR